MRMNRLPELSCLCLQKRPSHPILSIAAILCVDATFLLDLMSWRYRLSMPCVDVTFILDRYSYTIQGLFGPYPCLCLDAFIGKFVVSCLICLICLFLKKPTAMNTAMFWEFYIYYSSSSLGEISFELWFCRAHALRSTPQQKAFCGREDWTSSCDLKQLLRRYLGPVITNVMHILFHNCLFSCTCMRRCMLASLCMYVCVDVCSRRFV